MACAQRLDEFASTAVVERMKVFGLAGWQGSGKTTLVLRLLPELKRRGLTVSTVTYVRPSFDIDMPGKDSYEHRAAGATEVMVSSVRRWALVSERRDASEPELDTLIARMTPADLLLVEGFDMPTHNKIEVYRAAGGKSFLYPRDQRVVALASDAPVQDAPVPVFDLDDAPAIADFIMGHCALKAA